MSQYQRYERILALADRLSNGSDQGSGAVAQDLYKTILTSDQATLDKLKRSMPEDAQRSDAWQRNNLRISDPKPRRVLEGPQRLELGAFLSMALGAGEVFKAFGAGWGMSQAAVSHDWLLPMVDSFDQVLPPGNGTCTMNGGARIKTLDAALAGTNQALTNAPGFDELTFPGVVAMGGHGSGLGIAALSEHVSSLELLSVDRNGQPSRREFVKGDPLFPAVTTSLGALGIVTRMSITVEQMYFVEETRVMRRFREVEQELPVLLARQRSQELHSVDIWVNPYRVRDEDDVWCVVGTRKKVPGPAHGERGWALTHGDRLTFEALCVFMRVYPGLVPVLLDAALSLTEATKVVMPAAVGVAFGTPNLAPVIASECAVDVNEALPTVRALLEGLQQRSTRGEGLVTSPIGLRFVGASTAWMSPAHARETCTIELPILACTKRARETLEWFVRVAVPHGRPHWGQWNPLTGSELRERYPRQSTAAFFEAMAELDPFGVFANEMVRDLRVSWGPAEPAVRQDLQRMTAWNCEDSLIRSYSRLFCDPEGQVHPVPPEQVALELTSAKDGGRSLTLRGAGNALHTQALRPEESAAQDGYLVLATPPDSTAAKISVDAAEKTLTVRADAKWHDIVHETLAHGLLPMVVVTAPDATVGGTLASNSIGQACRRFGHEADGLLNVTIITPGDVGEAPRCWTVAPPLPSDDSQEARLFRAVIRGFGHVGVIQSAKYRLIEVPRDDQLLPVERCGGRGGSRGQHCVAVTDIEAFPQERLAEALNRLIRPSSGDDGVYRACALFHIGDSWTARVSSTYFERGSYGPHLLTYEGDTPGRRVAEHLLSTMPTAYVAGRVAAKLTENGASGYRDPACGYLFTMLPNDSFKSSLPETVRAAIAPTVQMTFVIPEPNAVVFLERAFRILRLRSNSEDHGALQQTLAELSKTGGLRGWLVEVTRKALHMEQRYFGGANLSHLSDEQTLHSLLSNVLGLSTLIPALFEMVWLPGDQQLLSSTYHQSGFAISMAFQGPGCNENGFLEGWYPFSVIAENLYRALPELSEAALEYCGAVHLTKNVFVGNDPKRFTCRMLKERLEAFRAVRDEFDPRHVLVSSFGRRILGL
ncbi:MAG TPA: D-arabinono-1,4-lactone oxidase [Polyangiaceae bacterium]|nr:D-arabinono-1,4-lactone oxidase [Polyangiaceae bacterium]